MEFDNKSEIEVMSENAYSENNSPDVSAVYKSNLNRKENFFKMIIIGLVCVVVLGMIFGIYFLLVSPRRNFLQGEESYREFLDDKYKFGIHASTEIDGENFTSFMQYLDTQNLPDELENFNFSYDDFVFASRDFFATKNQNGFHDFYYIKNNSTIFERVTNFSLNGEIISSFLFENFICDGVALVSDGNQNFYVCDLESNNIVCVATGFSSIAVEGDYLILYSNGNHSNFAAVRVVDLVTKNEVLNIGEDALALCVNVTSEYMQLLGDNFSKFYFYKNGFSDPLTYSWQKCKQVSASEISDGDVVFTQGVKNFKALEFSVPIVFMNGQMLFEKYSPVTNLSSQNYKAEIEISSGEKRTVGYRISHYICDVNNLEKLKNIELGGKAFFTSDSEYFSDQFFGLFVQKSVGKDDSLYKVILSHEFEKIVCYDYLKFGEIVGYSDDLYLTYGSGNSALINNKGEVSNNIDVSKYQTNSSLLFNDKFVVTNGEYSGVTNFSGDLITSLDILELSPIFGNVAVGYISGAYYLLDLVKGTAKLIENYDEEFHKYVMLGIGLYMTKNNDGSHNLHLLDENINSTNYCVYGIKSYNLIKSSFYENQTISLACEGENSVFFISLFVTNPNFFSKLDSYVAREIDGGIDHALSYKSLVFSDMSSYTKYQPVKDENGDIAEYKVRFNDGVINSGNKEVFYLSDFVNGYDVLFDERKLNNSDEYSRVMFGETISLPHIFMAETNENDGVVSFESVNVFEGWIAEDGTIFDGLTFELEKELALTIDVNQDGVIELVALFNEIDVFKLNIGLSNGEHLSSVFDEISYSFVQDLSEDLSIAEYNELDCDGDCSMLCEQGQNAVIRLKVKDGTVVNSVTSEIFTCEKRPVKNESLTNNNQTYEKEIGVFSFDNGEVLDQISGVEWNLSMVDDFSYNNGQVVSKNQQEVSCFVDADYIFVIIPVGVGSVTKNGLLLGSLIVEASNSQAV